MNDKSLGIKIEALLFALGKPLSKADLAKKLHTTPEEITASINARSFDGGVVIVDDGEMLELRAAPEAAELIEEVRKEEFSRDIGRAGLEALSAIIYRGPLTRAEIDFIRGVNSSQTLRTLLMRGLVRKVPNPKDERSVLYEPTTELLSHLGVTALADVPDFKEVQEKLKQLESSYHDAATQ